MMNRPSTLKNSLTLIFCVCLWVSFAQKKKDKDTSALVIQPGRIEFSKQVENADFYVISAGEEGLLVVEETREYITNGYQWNIHYLDTALNVVWSRKEVVASMGSLVGYEYAKGNFYLLFNRDQYRSEKLQVLQFGAAANTLKVYDLTTVFPINISHFESIGQTLLVGGYANARPVIIAFDINDRIPKVVPGFYDDKNQILDLVVDERAKLFTVVMSERMRNRRYTVRVKTFNDRGDLIQNNALNPGEKKSLLDGATTSFSGGLQYLAGTHSKRSLQYSQGFYLSKFVNGQQQINKYYPFAALTNFWDYLKPKREERIQKRIQRKEEKGKVKKFNYRLLVHEIIQRGEEYIMIAEAYYPRYNYSNNRNFGGYGGFNTTSSRFNNPYFLGYKYTHAVVVGFDKNCHIIWDHTFKIEDRQSYDLKENVAVSAGDKSVVLMYLEENEIRSKVVQGSEVVEGRSFSPVKLSSATDELKTKSSALENIERWYEDTLIAYGNQSIRNTAVFPSVSRKVFYINKIKYAQGRSPN